MKILLISFEGDRRGAIRLVKALYDGGAAVAALCPPNHDMAQTRFLSGGYALEQVRSRRKIELALSEAMRDWRPSLVIPGERAIAFLHALMRRADTGAPTKLDAASLVVLARSLGECRHYNSLLLKNETLALARRLGLRTPEGGSVSSAEEAMALAKRIGFPVYLKSAFSWAGQGVVRCQGPEDIATACCHLGPRIGVDLSQALIDALKGEVKSPPPAGHAETVAPFPQEWQRSPSTRAAFPGFVDAPEDDEASVARMMQVAEAARLRSKLQSRLSIRPSAVLPACASAWTRRPPRLSLPKQGWKNAFAPHSKAARAFRL